MKGSRDMVDGLGDEIEKWISESSEKIKVGDKIESFIMEEIKN